VQLILFQMESSHQPQEFSVFELFLWDDWMIHQEHIQIDQGGGLDEGMKMEEMRKEGMTRIADV